jgi:predicted CXXCH cytochrome family protein
MIGASLAISVAGISAGSAAQHPRLVSAGATDCSVCHEDLFEERGNLHGPARDDCTACHEVETGEGGTRITLMEGEPPLCLSCHDELAPAAAGEVAVPHYPVTESCLHCHEPHAASQPALLIAPKTELCGGCHPPEGLNRSHGEQITPATDCSRCHQPHGSDHERLLRAAQVHVPFADGSCQGCHRPALEGRIRLRARGERLCTSCHGEFAPAELDIGSVHAAMRGERGKAGCLNCHDPHMSMEPKLVVAAGIELCRSCHAEIVAQASAGSGHAPAADDCLSCHLPHASPRERLLNETPPHLCHGCHDPSDADLAASHLDADLASLQCTTCHSPHGEGQPHLLAKNVHEPLLDGCDSCHDAGAGSLFEQGESALCLMCHEETGDAAASAAVPHAALEISRCVDCHDPHASRQEHLIALPAGGTCLACHEDQATGPEEVPHGVIETIGCRACHEPHGGSRPKLLRAAGAELCLACHEPSRAGLEGRFEVTVAEARAMATLRLSADGMGGHPTPNHRALGQPTAKELERHKTTFEGELSCLTCHDPHKGRSKKILRWGAVTSMQACNQCHAK